MRIVSNKRQADLVTLKKSDGFGFVGPVVRRFDDFTASFTDEFKDWLFSIQDGKCGYCGCVLGEDWSGNPNAHVEHIKPRRLGGEDRPPNLMYACRSCNTSKSNEHYSSLHVKWALKESPVGEVISSKVATRLLHMGVLILKTTDTYHFERMGWTHVLPLPCPVEHSTLAAALAEAKKNALTKESDDESES
jgi:hypothetical protein